MKEQNKIKIFIYHVNTLGISKNILEKKNQRKRQGVIMHLSGCSSFVMFLVSNMFSWFTLENHKNSFYVVEEMGEDEEEEEINAIDFLKDQVLEAATVALDSVGIPMGWDPDRTHESPVYHGGAGASS
ncbi:hypothetical protein ACJX0J_023946, partial [Zea mays]